MLSAVVTVVEGTQEVVLPLKRGHTLVIAATRGPQPAGNQFRTGHCYLRDSEKRGHTLVIAAIRDPRPVGTQFRTRHYCLKDSGKGKKGCEPEQLGKVRGTRGASCLMVQLF